MDYDFINKQIEKIQKERKNLNNYLRENSDWFENASLEELREYIEMTNGHSEKQFVFRRIFELTEEKVV